MRRASGVGLFRVIDPVRYTYVVGGAAQGSAQVAAEVFRVVLDGPDGLDGAPAAARERPPRGPGVREGQHPRPHPADGTPSLQCAEPRR